MNKKILTIILGIFLIAGVSGAITITKDWNLTKEETDILNEKGYSNIKIEVENYFEGRKANANIIINGEEKRNIKVYNGRCVNEEMVFITEVGLKSSCIYWEYYNENKIDELLSEEAKKITTKDYSIEEGQTISKEIIINIKDEIGVITK